MPEVLNVDSVSHQYGATSVLSEVSLTVSDGELVSVLGRSGAGKTTLLRAIGGFITPAAGSIRLGGVEVCRNGTMLVKPERRGLGIVFQDYALFSHMTVRQNVGFGLSAGERKSGRIDTLLQMVGMAPHAEKRPAELSGGQQQRVALARALAPQPSLLLLDEPFANLDAALRTELEHELRQLLQRSQTAALMITHDRREALSVADRTAVLETGPNGGWIAQCDTPEAIYTAPKTQEVAQLTGDCSLVPAQATGDIAESDLGALPLTSNATGAITVLIRPESLRLAYDADGAGQVLSRTFEGAMCRYQVAFGALRLDIAAPSAERFSPGEAVSVRANGPLHWWPITS